MERIGLYTQLTEFTTEHAGTAEWCKAERDGHQYFVKKFQSPVYPKKDIGLPEKMYNAGVAEFKEALALKTEIYRRLRECDQSGVLVVPLEVINYQFHICTIADFVVGNVSAEQVCLLSEWQRLVLMRTLTLALMNVHSVGVVHSDMKPDNVLITQDDKGHCKLHLIDFDGSFMEANPPTDPEEVVGDPTFFSPEAYQQAMDEDVRLDRRIDIFALGIIFHYFWCGKYPIKPDDQTVGECLVRGGSVSCDSSIPTVLSQLIMRMISADPSDRLTLKSVYEVLGVQISRSTPSIINLQPVSTVVDETEKTVEVRVHFCDDRGKVLKYRTLLIPYGSKRVVEAEEITGYRLVGLKTRELVVDAKGHTNSPVVFEYKPEVEEKKTEKKVFLTLLWLFVIYWIIMFLLSMGAYNNGQYSEAKQYMDLTPFFSMLFEPTYSETERMLNQSGESSETNDSPGAIIASSTTTASPIVTRVVTAQPVVTKTPRPTATVKSNTAIPRTATPAPTRNFAINTSVTYNKGKTTVRWTDTQNAGPYNVAFEYIGSGSAIQSSFWAGGNRSSSTTSNKYFVIDDLIPGHQYIIKVTDRNNNTIRSTVRIPSTSDFVDGRLKSTSIAVTIGYRYKDSSGNISRISAFESSVMKRQISNNGYEYGLRYEMNVPQLATTRNYYQQIVFYAPNGYAQTVNCSSEEFSSANGQCTYYLPCIGGYFFECLLEKNGVIPVGKYTVELYWDGMLVNRSYFYVE